MPATLIQTTPGLTFDPETHTYRLDGEILRGVTGTLRDMELCRDTSFWKPEHALRGTMVHEAVHALAEDDLDWSVVPEHIAPFVQGYEKFRRDSGWQPLLVETPLASRRYRYAGRMDQLGELNGLMTLVDLKSGSTGHLPWHDLQLAAYDELLRENAKWLGLKPVDLPKRHYILQLTRDGGYRLHEPTTPIATARGLFLSALAILEWKGR